MSGTCQYFPNQTPLTEAIYKVFNENADLVLSHFNDPETMTGLMLGKKVEAARTLGGLSVATREQNTDPSNLVTAFVSGYNELDTTDQRLFRKVVRSLSDAIADAAKRDPGALDRAPDARDRNMLSFFGSNPAVRELLVNQKGIV